MSQSGCYVNLRVATGRTREVHGDANPAYGGFTLTDLRVNRDSIEHLDVQTKWTLQDLQAPMVYAGRPVSIS